jgi:sugar/nucleoside kinase (ribokinase family)
MKKIVALSNLVTDIIQNTSDEHIQTLGFTKGLFHIATPEQSAKLAKEIETGLKIPGGSAANVVVGAKMLGAQTGLIGTVGNDSIGQLYHSDIKQREVESYITDKEGQSGVCHTFITEDGERTFVLDFGVSQEFEINETQFENSQIFHTTAYELSGANELTKTAIELAKSKNLEISFDLADPGVVKNFKENIQQTINGIDILFANEEEAKEYTGFSEPEDALEELARIAKIAIVKLGANGSMIRCGDEIHKIPVVQLEKLVNTNGAGDAYAAGFLSAYAAGKTLKEAGEQGSSFAARACMSDGARISE